MGQWLRGSSGRRSVAEEGGVLDRKVNPGRSEPAVLDVDPCQDSLDANIGVRGRGQQPVVLSAKVKVPGKRDGRERAECRSWKEAALLHDGEVKYACASVRHETCPRHLAERGPPLDCRCRRK
jgi:hypothetical protein